MNDATPSDAGTICTYTGVQFDVLNPRPEMVWLADIAHALASQTRFNGHTIEPYSIAQHSVLVSVLVPEHLALHGLMHDAAEAYLGDCVRPVKALLPQFKDMEMGTDGAICERFGIDQKLLYDAEVKKADNLALRIEQRDLMPETDWWRKDDLPEHPTIQVWRWDLARRHFLNRFRELSGTGFVPTQEKAGNE